MDSRRFNWTIEDIAEQKISVKLNFDRPEMISAYGSDILSLHVNVPSAFLNRPLEFYDGDLEWGSKKLLMKRNIPK